MFSQQQLLTSLLLVLGLAQQLHGAISAGLPSRQPKPLDQGVSSLRLDQGVGFQSQLAQASPGISSSREAQQWLQDSAQYSRRYTRGSCFHDYPGLIAKDITGALGFTVLRGQQHSSTAAQGGRGSVGVQLVTWGATHAD
jgi:hypothetical protein